MISYRICEVKNGELYTLFHAVDGSRKLPMRQWLYAKTEPVRDGSRERATRYISGFHSIPDYTDCLKFLSRFRAERMLAVVKCRIGGGIWKKKHSPANILLSKKMKLLKIVSTHKIPGR